MAFDITTAKPIGRFDIKTAKPLEAVSEGKNRRASLKDVFSREDLSLGEKLGQLLPSGESIKTAQTEVISPLAAGASTAAFGLPRLAARAAGKEEDIFPEQQTGFGKTLRLGSEVAGLFGGGAAALSKGAGKLTTKLGSKFLPSVLGLGKSTIGKAGKRRLAQTMLNTLKGGVEGATFGVTQLDIGGSSGLLNEVETPGELVGSVGKQALTGALLGGAISSGGRFIKRAKKARRRFKTSATVSRRVGSTEKPAVKTLQERTTLAIQSNKKAGAETAKRSTQAIKENIDAMRIDLENAAAKGSLKFQEQLPEFFKANSKAYGNVLDDISNSMVRNNESFITAEIDDVISKTLNDLDEAGIAFGRPREVLQALKNKYRIKFIGGQQPKSFTTPRSNADVSVNFKDFIEDFKILKNSLSTGAKTGSSRFTQEDIAVSMFKKNLGELLTTRAGGEKFLGLQKEYAPVIKLMKTANKTFKPSQGQFEAKTGATLLKRVAEKSAKGITDSETELVEALELGNKFSKGTGDISSGVKELGKSILQNKRSIQPVKDSIAQQVAKQDAILTDRLRRLKFTEESIKNLLRDKDKKQALAKKIGIRALLTGTGLGVVALGSKALRRD